MPGVQPRRDDIIECDKPHDAAGPL